MAVLNGFLKGRPQTLDAVEHINKTIYENLEQILQKLDDRLELKLYAVVRDDNGEIIQSIQVKSILGDQQGQETEFIQEELDGPEEVFAKLGLAVEDANTNDFLSNLSVPGLTAYLTRTEHGSEPGMQEFQTDAAIDETVLPVRSSIDESIFYTNWFELEEDSEACTIKYILSIENVDQASRFIYIHKPRLSFLKMILDYYFRDYYNLLNDTKLIVDGEAEAEIEIKYKENGIQFLQRMARLFLGKMQNFIINGTSLSDVSEEDTDLTETVRNQYYINNLLEKIDGISTRTYEGESPFGCMLLLKTNMLLEDSKLVNYSIQFQNQQPINLEDARRIRKLLELTNNERDLYLIADDKAIYGVGEIDWSQLQDNLVFKVEFKGLSRYDLLLVTTEQKDDTEARVVAEHESKVFKRTVNLEIVSRKLVSVSFKQPGIGAGGFTAELFRRTMRTQFQKANPPVTVTDEAIEKLRLVIQKATEQQHGTMVVITDPTTAELELEKLRKQSTPILPTGINPAFIKHLTSIDGAIYFDTSGACHAIGVILDGLAQAHLGDSSRGARFHSAYRYLEKLKDDKKSCVIAIISEDGMVNLIPEQVNEAMVRQLVREMIGCIRGNDSFSEDAFQNYESRLEEAAGTASIDHHHYFKVADTFFEKSHFGRAASYYQKGLDGCGHFYLKYNRELALSYLKHAMDTSSENKLLFYTKAAGQHDFIIETADTTEINHEDYNRRGIAYHQAGSRSDQSVRTEYYNKSLDDFVKAIELKIGNKYVLYRNRGYLYNSMNKDQEALDDFICSEIEFSEDTTLNLIKKLIDKDVPLFLYALTSYSKKKTAKKDSENLRNLLAEHGAELAVEHPEVAAALEQYGMEGPQTENE